MNTESDLYRLLTWMSPAFPVGAFSFSHGLEYAIEIGLLKEVEDTQRWIADLLTFGNGQADLVFLAHAWDASSDEAKLATVQELALAFQSSAEIRLETTAQGSAFVKACAAAWPCEAVAMLEGIAEPGTLVYPVAVGAIARAHECDKAATMNAFAHAFVANLVSAALRLIPLGQSDGQRIVASLLPAARDAIEIALGTSLHDVSNACVMADITSMRHETQYTRLFRS